MATNTFKRKFSTSIGATATAVGGYQVLLDVQTTAIGLALANVTVPGTGKVSILFGDGGGSGANVISLSDTLAMSNPEITGGSVTNLTDLSMINAAAQVKAQNGLNVDAAGTAVALSIALG